MSLMTDPKASLEGAIGPTGELERLLSEKVDAAREFVRAGEELLRAMRGERREPLDSNRYAGLDPYAAMMVFFRSSRGRAVTEEEIAEELVSGNVKTGSAKQDPASKKPNVVRSLKAQVNTGAIKKVGDKYGLPEWGEEAFE